LRRGLRSRGSGVFDDGKFNAKALAALGRSFVDLELAASEPKDMQRLYTEEFLPTR